MARPKGTTPTVYAALRIPADVGKLWDDTSRELGLSKTATMILAIKKLAKAEGIEARPNEEQS